jgi:hypothetical protein
MELTEDDIGKILYSGNKTYQVDRYLRLVPVATNKSYIKSRNKKIKEKIRSGIL